MKRIFIETPSFTKRWYALGFNEDDLAELQQYLIKNPDAGDTMVGTGGLRKIRYAFEGRGKSGSARVCYVDFEIHGRIVLIMVFAKNEMENLSKAERNNLKMLIARLEKSMEKVN